MAQDLGMHQLKNETQPELKMLAAKNWRFNTEIDEFNSHRKAEPHET